MPRKGWKTISVPEEFHSILKKLKREYGESMWKVCARAFSLYLKQQEDIDRYFYYATKILNSWAMVKCTIYLFDKGYVPLSVVEEQMNKFMKTLKQIDSRTRVSTKGVINLLGDFMKIESSEEGWKHRGKFIGSINDEVRKVARSLLIFSE